MMSKMKLSALALVVMAGASSAAMAAGTAEMKVTGKINAATCDVAVGGTIDYGQIAISSLNTDATADTALPSKTLPGGVTITCEASTSISVAFKDNRFSSAGGNTSGIKGSADGGVGLAVAAGKGSGLGLDSAGAKVGGYTAVIFNAKVDGVKYNLAAVNNNGAVISGSAGQVTADDGDSEYTSTSIATPGKVASGKTFFFDYGVLAQIAPRSKLNLSKPIDLDGSMAVQVNYL
jgi:type 1 fimbria pilin